MGSSGYSRYLELYTPTHTIIGNLAETLGEMDKALNCFEHALKHNPYSVSALTRVASIYRAKEQFAPAADVFQRILNLEANNGEIWGALGHCYLMLDDLPKAYNSYQQALYYLPNPKEPKLWYGIGILYDRYGSLEHAEEAFSSVLKIDPKFEKANEIYFRLGVIYKQQGKYDQALQCFRYVLPKPPRPLTEADVMFQFGHVHELQGQFDQAKEAYERVLKDHPNHAKVLQQLGWLYHQEHNFHNEEQAVVFLTKAIDCDKNDPQSWYLLGRCYMSQQQYKEAYEAYQHAVYRDGKNPVFWCSIGILYYQISQYRDALDAYTRAIRLNPYVAEVWHNLGTLYESCNNQIQDAIDAYAKAAELDPKNTQVRDRLAYLKQWRASGDQNPENAIPPPPVMDINPNTYRQMPAGTMSGRPSPSTQGPPSASSTQVATQQTSQAAPAVPGTQPLQQPPVQKTSPSSLLLAAVAEVQSQSQPTIPAIAHANVSASGTLGLGGEAPAGSVAASHKRSAPSPPVLEESDAKKTKTTDSSQQDQDSEKSSLEPKSRSGGSPQVPLRRSSRSSSRNSLNQKERSFDDDEEELADDTELDEGEETEYQE